MYGHKKYLILAATFFGVYALIDLIFFKNCDFGNWLLATILYVFFSVLVDKLCNRW